MLNTISIAYVVGGISSLCLLGVLISAPFVTLLRNYFRPLFVSAAFCILVTVVCATYLLHAQQALSDRQQELSFGMSKARVAQIMGNPTRIVEPAAGPRGFDPRFAVWHYRVRMYPFLDVIYTVEFINDKMDGYGEID